MAEMVEKKGGSNIWITPPEYVEPVHRYAPIGLDPCTEPRNPTNAATFFTEEDDGLVQDWTDHGLVYVNPPYSTVVDVDRAQFPDTKAGEKEYKAAVAQEKRRIMSDLKDQGQELFGVRRAYISSLIVLWCLKINRTVRAGAPLIALLPCGARFSTKYWQENILCHELTAMCFVEGRIPFIEESTGEPANGNLYDSIYYGFNVDGERFASAFDSLGCVLQTRRHRVGMLDGFI